MRRFLSSYPIRMRLGADDRAFVAACLLALGIVIQVRLVHPLDPNLGIPLLVLVICAAVAGSLLASMVQRERVEESPPVATWSYVSGAAALAGIACAIVSAKLVSGDLWNAQWWWIGGMALPVAALAVVTAQRSFTSSDRRIHTDRVELGLCIALFLVALAPRLPDITSSPPALFGDEASCGLYGRLFNAGHTPLLSISWYGLPMLSYAVNGLGFRLFGDTWAGMRTMDAVIGSLGVMLIYLLGKEWFGRLAGALAALVLAFSFLHLELSRDGLHYIQGPTCITLSLYLTTLWLKRGGALPALLTGMSFSLDLQVYWSARIAPLLVLGLLGFLLLFRRQLLWRRRGEIAWMVVGAVVAGLPVATLFAANPGTFNAHQGSVTIFSDDPNTKGHLISQYGHISTLQLVKEQAWRVLTTFNARGDASALFGAWPGTLLDTVTSVLLPGGIALALWRCKQWQYTVCLAWFASVVLAGIITIDPPIWPRLLALLPAVALLVGVLLAGVYEALRPQMGRWSPALGLLAPALVAIAALNLNAAFVDFPDVARQETMEATYTGQFLARAPGANNTVLLSDGTMYVDYEPIRFLAPRAAGCTLLPKQPLNMCPGARSSKLFVLLPGRVGDLAWLMQQRPGGRIDTVATYAYSTAHILAYELR